MVILQKAVGARSRVLPHQWGFQLKPAEGKCHSAETLVSRISTALCLPPCALFPMPTGTCMLPPSSLPVGQLGANRAILLRGLGTGHQRSLISAS